VTVNRLFKTEVAWFESLSSSLVLECFSIYFHLPGGFWLLLPPSKVSPQMVMFCNMLQNKVHCSMSMDQGSAVEFMTDIRRKRLKLKRDMTLLLNKMPFELTLR
jgi:hypothetical protein